MQRQYTKKHLQEALQREGLPHTYSTIRKYEDNGVIPRSENPIEFGEREWRMYSETEIKNIVMLVKKYKKSQ